MATPDMTSKSQLKRFIHQGATDHLYSTKRRACTVCRKSIEEIQTEGLLYCPGPPDSHVSNTPEKSDDQEQRTQRSQ